MGKHHLGMGNMSYTERMSFDGLCVECSLIESPLDMPYCDMVSAPSQQVPFYVSHRSAGVSALEMGGYKEEAFRRVVNLFNSMLLA